MIRGAKHVQPAKAPPTLPTTIPSDKVIHIRNVYLIPVLMPIKHTMAFFFISAYLSYLFQCLFFFFLWWDRPIFAIAYGTFSAFARSPNDIDYSRYNKEYEQY